MSTERSIGFVEREVDCTGSSDWGGRKHSSWGHCRTSIKGWQVRSDLAAQRRDNERAKKKETEKFEVGRK